MKKQKKKSDEQEQRYYKFVYLIYIIEQKFQNVEFEVTIQGEKKKQFELLKNY